MSHALSSFNAPEGITRQIWYETKLIDRETAQNLLSVEDLRGGSLRDPIIENYAEIMARGDWWLTGEPIILTAEGKLMNGRKRLRACVRSGASFRCLVISNISAESVETVDTRRVRKLSDVLSIDNADIHRALSIALRFAYNLRDGQWNGKRVSTQSLIAFYKVNLGIRTSVRFVDELGFGRRAQPMAAALHYVLSRIDAFKAAEVFRLVANGSRLDDGSPERALWRRLDAISVGEASANHKELAAYYVRAWNASCRSEKVRSISFASEREPFPEIFGWRSDLPMPEPSLDTSKHANHIGDDLEVEVAFVTPEMAKIFLSRNVRNRRVNKLTVDKYARDINRGRWEFNGETIKFGRSGNLLDGQHRCRAIIESGVGFWCIVVSGIDDAAYAALDQGEVNTYEAVLLKRGVKYSSRVSSAARLLWLHESGQILSSHPCSHADLDDVLARHPGLLSAWSGIHQTRSKLPPSVATLANYYFSSNDPVRAKVFFERLVTGFGFDGPNDPVLKTRDALSSLKQVDLGGIQESAYRFAIVVKGWNAFRRGQDIKGKLAWKYREEAFPQVA